MSHIFISYSKKNKDYARRLADYLLEHGFDVWIDDRIDYGDNWLDTMYTAVLDCAAFVVVMTPEAKASRWVQGVVARADKWDKPMFPVLRAGENWPIF
ncbi:MAG TPA: toll/interleukin-1 receptor domain-containing protein, partial [Aggregatilineaceae bacterium]|nr:toll/interleukin-1 receptor domain-containing protein [Aggregatilineaceae bacterium]